MKTLILNLDYSPLSTVSWHRGLILSLNNKNMSVLEYYDLTVNSECDIFEIPSVMIYEKYVRPPIRKIVSKKYILLRDGMTCQYCMKKLDKSSCSVDHVIPLSSFKSKNEANTWNNLVACCKRCNTKKGNKTPEQAGMRLIRKPKSPSGFLMIDSGPIEWEKYIGNRMQNSGLAVET